MNQYTRRAQRRIAAGRLGSPLLSAAILMFVVVLTVTGGCIKNDLPFPKIPQYITALAADGETSQASLDNNNYSATVYLSEDVDICNVRFTQFEYTEGAECSPNLLEGTYDLSGPIVVTLERYQKYQWVVKGVQHIERYFNVEGQLGETVIDEVGHRIIVTVLDNVDLTSLKLTSIKLGPSGHTDMVPDLQPGTINLSKPLRITVTSWGRPVDWTVYCEKSASVVNLTQVDPWSCVVWAYGSGPADVKNTFQYREAGTEQWTEMPISAITQTSGAFSACIPHLKPLTKYEVRAVSGENVSSAQSVTTQSTEVLPDGNFDQWWLNGKVWNPWNEGGERFWDTGNKGATVAGDSNVQPSDHVPPGLGGKSARLETCFANIMGIGKLATGSIYTGEFVKVDGTNGILAFGRPWKVRPTKLRGYYQYHTVPIDYADTDHAYMKGRPDSCAIYIALTDWTAPYEIRTRPTNRQLFDPNASYVIAYGELTRGSDTDGYEEFEITLNYRDTSKVPTYIQVTAAASKYGDYFTGGAGSLLYVDQFSLDYDY